MRAQITLYTDDAKRFKQLREEVEELRDGYEPARSEMVRLMMDQFDPEEAVGGGRQRRR